MVNLIWILRFCKNSGIDSWKTTNRMKSNVKELLKASSHWVGGSKATERSSGPIPHIAEDDL